MSTKKVDRALYGPSTAEVAMGALLGLLAGVLVAIVTLIFKPVITVRELPEEPAIGAVYYLEGSTDALAGRSWSAKQTLLIGEENIQVGEAELNAWAGSFEWPVITAEKSPPEGSGFLIPSRPNFRIADDTLQVGVPVTLNYFGVTHSTLLLATGDFKRSGKQVVFSPEKVYLGSCPLHVIPGAGKLLISRILAKTKFTDQQRSAWSLVKTVTIRDGVLEIAVR